jgi:uncharacterized membrane protein
LKFLNSQIERFEKKTHKELGYALTKSSSNGYKNGNNIQLNLFMSNSVHSKFLVSQNLNNYCAHYSSNFQKKRHKIHSQIERFEKKTHKELGYALTKSSSNGYKNVCI